MTISPDFFFVLHVFGRLLQNLSGAPLMLCSTKDVLGVIRILDNSQICVGNRDQEFVTFIKHHKGVLTDATGMPFVHVHTIGVTLVTPI